MVERSGSLVYFSDALMCKPSRFFSATPAPQVTWSPLDLKLAWTCVVHESYVATSSIRPDPLELLSTFTLRKIPSFRRLRAVSSAVAESNGAPSGIEQLAPHHVLTRHNVERVGGPEEPRRALGAVEHVLALDSHRRHHGGRLGTSSLGQPRLARGGRGGGCRRGHQERASERQPHRSLDDAFEGESAGDREDPLRGHGIVRVRRARSMRVAPFPDAARMPPSRRPTPQCLPGRCGDPSYQAPPQSADAAKPNVMSPTLSTSGIATQRYSADVKNARSPVKAWIGYARGLNVSPGQLLTRILHASADVGNDGPARRRAQRHGHLRRDAPRFEPRPTSSAPKQQKSVARSGSARSLRSTAGRLRSISTPSWPRAQQSSRPAWRRKSTPQRVPERSQEKIAGTRWDPGDWNCLGFKTSQRAGDGTRTRDVQLGKLAFYQLNYAREVQVR